jgi:hypothetical protein
MKMLIAGVCFALSSAGSLDVNEFNRTCPFPGKISADSKNDTQCAEMPCTASIAADLSAPPVVNATPAAGLRVRHTLTGTVFEDTQVWHALYLPRAWAPGGNAASSDYKAKRTGAKKWPVIVEWSGNGIRPEDWYSNGNWTSHGWGIAQGLLRQQHRHLEQAQGQDQFIWLSLPLVSAMRGPETCNMRSWWGCEPNACDLYGSDQQYRKICSGEASIGETKKSGSTENGRNRKRRDDANYNPEPSVAYAILAVQMVIRDFGGDPDRIIATGHSRGSLAVNAIGLHNDTISGLWTGFAPASHYDGAEAWQYDPGPDFRANALVRLERIGGRPVFIAGECNLATGITAQYLNSTGVDLRNFTVAGTGLIDHNSFWLLRSDPGRVRERLRSWSSRIVYC